MGIDKKYKPYGLGDWGYDSARQQANRFFRPSSNRFSDLTAYLKDCKVASSGLKKTLIQRVFDHKGGLLRTRVVGEKRSREESGGVIEDGDVGAGSSVYQGRGRRKVTPLLVVEVM